MPTLTKVPTEDVMLPSRVQLLLFRSDGQARGNIILPSLTRGNVIESSFVAETQDAAVAARTAIDLADKLATDVDVSDPQGLWDPAWGELR